MAINGASHWRRGVLDLTGTCGGVTRVCERADPRHGRASTEWREVGLRRWQSQPGGMPFSLR